MVSVRGPAHTTDCCSEDEKRREGVAARSHTVSVVMPRPPAFTNRRSYIFWGESELNGLMDCLMNVTVNEARRQSMFVRTGARFQAEPAHRRQALVRPMSPGACVAPPNASLQEVVSKKTTAGTCSFRPNLS